LYSAIKSEDTEALKDIQRLNTRYNVL